MDYVYGQISQKAIKNTYTGASTKTADVIVDNANSTISVVARLDKEFNNIQNLTDGEGQDSLNQKNASALGNNSIALGSSIAGSKAFRLNYISTNAQDHTFETFNLNSVDGIEIGMEANIYIYDGTKDTNYMMMGVVEAIDGNDLLITTSIVDDSINIDNLVDSYIWFTGHSDIGDITIGTGAVAEGYNTNAAQIGSHSEGGNTLALGKYSHAEGRGSIAGGYCSHAEGRDTKAKGFYSSASGRASEANGDYSIAGIQGKANADNSISVGTSTAANAKYSIATGHGTIANKEDQVVLGKYNDHTSSALLMVGDGSSNENRHNAFEVYNDSVKINGSTLSKEKVDKIDEIPLNIKDAEGTKSVVSGWQNEATGACAFAGGATSKANNDYSFAYGVRLETGKLDQVVFGRENEVSNDALLVVGAGTSFQKANAFEVRKNSIKIGNATLLETDIPVLEKTTNKVTSIDASSTDTQYPSAKAVYECIQSVIPPIYNGGIE